MYEAMTQAFRDANEDAETRVIVLLGVPGAFSAGNDIADFANMAQRGSLGEPIIAFLQAFAGNEKPLVAGVDGLAIGIGTTILFHCDYVLASNRSLFKTPFTDLALVPEAASSLLAPRLMGHQKAFELLCMGEAFDGDAMEKAGVVNKVMEAVELEDATLTAARAIAAKPASAMTLSRALLRKASVAETQARIMAEADCFATQLASPEAQAAFAAFLKKK